MIIDAKKVLGAATRASFTVISRAIGIGFLGFVVNITVLVVLRAEMAGVIDRAGAMPIHGSGGSGAIILIGLYLLAIWPVSLMALGFGAAFPVVYFLLGKKYGVGRAIHAMIRDNRELIMNFLVERLWQRIAEQTGVRERGDRLISKAALLKALPGLFERMDTMPRPLRVVARMIAARIDFGGMVTGIVAEQKMSGDEIDFDLISRVILDKTAALVEERFQAPDLKWLAILLSVNGSAAVLLKVFL